MSLLVQVEKQLGDFRLETDFQSEGGVLGLLGASGSGKSMTLKCIAGIERPDRGRIVLNGETLFDSEAHIDLPPQKRHVGLLFQNYALFPNMTVEQNILCGMHGEKNRAVKETRLREALELLQLQGLEKHRPCQLSGGQAQRTALARILVSHPGLLMLDEPFAALDSHLRGKLQLEMRDLLKEFGHDVLLVTHSRDEAYRLCSRIAVMEAGKLLTVKETKELFAHPDSVSAARITGCKNIAAARACGPRQVEVPEWGIRMTTAESVGNDVKAIGVRAHSFTDKEKENSFPVRWAGELEEPFEWIFRFRFAGQPEDSEPLWWRVSKELRPERLPDRLSLDPKDVLLLYRE